jgi:hypothetical protein
MGKSDGVMQVTDEQGRRGAGRTMATLLAAQLWALDHDVAVFTDGSVQNAKWLASLHPRVAQRISVIHARTLEEVENRLLGTRFGKVFVDHAIVERSEDELERRIRALRDNHKHQLRDKETIR